MSWFDLRTRSPDPNAALLRDLIQAKIDAEIQAHEPEDQEHMEIGIESYSNMNIDDSLSWSFLRDVTLAFTDRNYIPREPDLDKLRLWIKNENGGHILHDHAKMGNIINSFGHHPPTLTKIGDQDGLTANRLCNIFDGNIPTHVDLPAGGQFMRISDNPNIRVQELLSNSAITFFIRLYPMVLPTRDYMVLFSKIDNEQATDGYIATIDGAGYLSFTIRKANKTVTIRAPQALPWQLVGEAKADYLKEYFQEPYYKTISPTNLILPDPIPFIDFVITCKFSDMSLSILQDGVSVATSTSSPLYSVNLTGHWRLDEGGNIGTTAQEQTPSLRTAYNSASVSGATNGTITNAIWNTPAGSVQPYLQFDGNGDYVTIPNYTAIQTLTEATLSVWYYHNSGGGNHRVIAQKGTAGAANSLKLHIESDGKPDIELHNNSNALTHCYSATVVQPGVWYHIVARWKAGTATTINVNNVKTTGSNFTGTLDTGSTNLLLGDTGAFCINGMAYDFRVWNRQLTDSEVTALYTEGRPASTFPAWKADPPIPSEIPGPITNPFVRYYNVPWDANAANRDTTKLHARIISGFANFYDTNDDTDIAGTLQPLPFTAIYDVQPAGGGGGGTPEVICDVSQDSSSHVELSSAERFRAGNQIIGGPHIGKTVTKIIPRGRKTGSPTGTVYGRVWKANGDLKATIGSYNVTTWSSTDGNQPEFTGQGVAILEANDVVGIEFSGGDSSNNLDVDQNDDDAIEPNWVGKTGTTGAWGTTDISTSTDIGMQILATPGAISLAYAIGKPTLRPPSSPAVNNRVVAAITGTGATGQIGKKITKVIVSMSKVGSPTGTIVCRIFKAGSITNTAVIGYAKTAADIPTTQGNITFEFDTEGERAAQTYALANGDKIGIEITGYTASDVNYFQVHYNETSTIAAMNAQYYQAVSPSVGWFATNTAWEMIGTFYEGGFTATIPVQYAHIKLDHATTRAAETFATGSAGIGKIITRITPRFQKFGNPTGSVSVVIRNSSGTQMTSFGSIDATADIAAGTAWQPKDFTNLANSRACAGGDIISIEYGAGDANNYVMVSMNLNHDNFDTTLSYAQKWAVPPGNIYSDAQPSASKNFDIAGTMATGGIATDPLGRTRVGQRCNSPNSVMRGKKVTRVIVYLHKVGTPPAATPVTIRVRKEGTDAIAAEIGSIVATTLTTAATAYTIQNVNNVYIMQQNDILTAEYDYGDDTNYVVLTRSKVDVFEATGNLSQIVDFNAPNYNALTSDLFGELWTGGDTYTPAVDEQPIRDPFYHHDLLIGAGGPDWSYYAAVGTITNHTGVMLIPEFRIYREELTVQQALNLFTNRCTISNIPYGKVAKVGTFGVAANA